jgi:two-component sensor histidine kinase
MLVFALVALPPTLIGVIEAIETAEVHSERLRDSVRNYAALASTYHHALIENSTNLLLDVSRNTLVVPDVGQPDAVACSDVLAAAIRPFPVYASLVLFDGTGATLCGSDPLHLPQGAAQSEYFAKAVETKGAYLSGYVLATEPPVPSLVLAQPVLNGAAEVSGVLALAIRLDGLDESERFLSLPMEGVVYLLDRDGVTLHSVTVPAALGPGGLPPAETIHQILLGQARIFESDARDGIARVYAVSTVEFGSLFLLVGAPKTSGGGWADWNLIAQVTLVFAIWISGVLAAWLGTRFLVTRWTQRLFETTTALSRGDLMARAELAGAPQEIRELGDTLAEMATRLNTRQGELKAAIEQKEEMLREIHHRIKNNLQTVTSLLNLYSRDVKNEPAMQALQNVRIRVQALALVHRHLYESPENRQINAKALLGELCQMIQLSSGGARNRVFIIADVAPVEIGIDRAVPLALLVTEVVTDALKNGFPDGRAGTVKVSLATVEGAGSDGGGTDGVGLRLSITHDGLERDGRERDSQDRQPGVNGQASLELELSASLIRGFAAQLDARDVTGAAGAASQAFTFPLMPEHPAQAARDAE